MSQGEDLLELLHSLEGQGRKDSAGVFTVDVRKLLPKLADFQLSRSEDYVLKLVQGALAGGASWVDVDCYGHRVEVRFDGPGLAPQQVEQLFAYVFEDQVAARALRHLAIGVTSALAHQARWVQLESGGVQRRWSMLELDSAHKPVRSRLKKGLTRFVLARSVGDTLGHWWENVGKKDILQMLLGGQQAMLPEQAALWRACRHCPVPLRINGQSINADSFGPAASNPVAWAMSLVGVRDDHYHPDHLLAERQLYGGYPGGFGFPARSRASRCERLATSRRPPAKGVACRLMVGIQYSLGWPSTLHFYQSGVEVATFHPNSQVPGLIAVVDANDLEVDLSQFALVATDRLRDRMAWVLDEGLQLAHWVRDHARQLPVPARLWWALDRLPPLEPV